MENNTKSVDRGKIDKGRRGGLMSKFFSSVRVWFDLFMGRPRYKRPAIQGTAEIRGKKREVAPQEDSVTKDIQSVKHFFGKILGRASVKVQPSTEKLSRDSQKALSVVTSSGVFTKVIRVFIIFAFLILLAYIAFRVYTLVQESGNSSNQAVILTPTQVPYRPSKPSVYAEDEKILELEETIKVLEREISGINIRETILTPPLLDYDIDFKE